MNSDGSKQAPLAISEIPPRAPACQLAFVGLSVLVSLAPTDRLLRTTRERLIGPDPH